MLTYVDFNSNDEINSFFQDSSPAICDPAIATTKFSKNAKKRYGAAIDQHGEACRKHIYRNRHRKSTEKQFQGWWRWRCSKTRVFQYYEIHVFQDFVFHKSDDV